MSTDTDGGGGNHGLCPSTDDIARCGARVAGCMMDAVEPVFYPANLSVHRHVSGNTIGSVVPTSMALCVGPKTGDAQAGESRAVHEQRKDLVDHTQSAGRCESHIMWAHRAAAATCPPLKLPRNKAGQGLRFPRTDARVAAVGRPVYGASRSTIFAAVYRAVGRPLDDAGTVGGVQRTDAFLFNPVARRVYGAASRNGEVHDAALPPEMATGLGRASINAHVYTKVWSDERVHSTRDSHPRVLTERGTRLHEPTTRSDSSNDPLDMAGPSLITDLRDIPMDELEPPEPQEPPEAEEEGEGEEEEEQQPEAAPRPRKRQRGGVAVPKSKGGATTTDAGRSEALYDTCTSTLILHYACAALGPAVDGATFADELANTLMRTMMHLTEGRVLSYFSHWKVAELNASFDALCRSGVVDTHETAQLLLMSACLRRDEAMQRASLAIDVVAAAFASSGLCALDPGGALLKRMAVHIAAEASWEGRVDVEWLESGRPFAAALDPFLDDARVRDALFELAAAQQSGEDKETLGELEEDVEAMRFDAQARVQTDVQCTLLGADGEKDWTACCGLFEWIEQHVPECTDRLMYHRRCEWARGNLALTPSRRTAKDEAVTEAAARLVPLGCFMRQRVLTWAVERGGTRSTSTREEKKTTDGQTGFVWVDDCQYAHQVAQWAAAATVDVAPGSVEPTDRGAALLARAARLCAQALYSHARTGNGRVDSDVHTLLMAMPTVDDSKDGEGGITLMPGCGWMPVEHRKVLGGLVKPVDAVLRIIKLLCGDAPSLLVQYTDELIAPVAARPLLLVVLREFEKLMLLTRVNGTVATHIDVLLYNYTKSCTALARETAADAALDSPGVPRSDGCAMRRAKVRSRKRKAATPNAST